MTDPQGRERDPLQSRRHRILRLFLRTPEEIVGSYLTDDEQAILMSKPSTNAFLLEATNEILIIPAPRSFTDRSLTLLHR